MSARERVVTLDVLRGLALCGVLIANLAGLYSGRMVLGPKPEGVLNHAADWFEHIFVSSKAQTMLTFLFGFGFAAQLLRAQHLGVPVIGVYLRRLVVLFAIGALHVTLLWWGDVTWTYAVAGSGLLVFLRVSDRTRLVIAAILVFAPSLVMAIPGVRPAVTSVFLDPAQFRAELGRFGAAYRGASFTGIMPAHVRLALVWGAPLFAWYYPWILGRFLIGYVAGTQGWFVRDGADHLAMFRRMLRWGLILAAASTGFYVAVELGAFDGYTLTTAGRVGQAALAEAGLLALAATYMAAVVLWMQRPGARRWLRLIAPAGRMPLTTYIAQSAICTSLFYGWGLGWGGRIGAAGCLAIGFAIFALEVCACHLWLRRFRFGPLEWVWRTAVYLRPQPMRIARPEITTAPGPADS